MTRDQVVRNPNRRGAGPLAIIGVVLLSLGVAALVFAAVVTYLNAML